ncbi:MAG: amidase family protein, partial [Bacilli bacterium]
MAGVAGAGAQGGIDEASILELQEFMERRTLTSRELVLHYMERIAAHDRAGAAINSVLELNPDALAIADALDAERRVTGTRGPLHGMPILLKDNIDTGDHMHTSAGSIALAESYAPEDSAVADRLREAGAVLLGKANMTEWANFIAEDMPNGYSSRGGQVRNPYGPGQFDVGGSSSGSGAAVASSFAVAAIGTETSGSILSPASANSVVGIKPTVGLISRHGIIPISHSQDTAGPMAKSVADAAILLGVLTGVDARDPVTRASVFGACRNYRQFLDPEGLGGARLGVLRPRYFEKLDSDRLAIFERALAAMAGAGAVIVDPVLLPEEDDGGHEVLIHEFKAALNAYLRRLSPRVPVHTL